MNFMAMTLRLSDEKDRTLERMAEAFKMSKNHAAAAAIDIAAHRPSHPDIVPAATRRLLVRYADLMERLSQA